MLSFRRAAAGEAVAAGELPPPPIGRAFGFRTPEVEEGRIGGNPLGTVRGGAIATLLDSCVGYAVDTTLPAGVGSTTCP